MIYLSYAGLYTDRSESGSGVGCAVILVVLTYADELLDYASIYTADLTAIVAALIWLSKFVIYSDSISTLEAVKRFSGFYPLI